MVPSANQGRAEAFLLADRAGHSGGEPRRPSTNRASKPILQGLFPPARAKLVWVLNEDLFRLGGLRRGRLLRLGALLRNRGWLGRLLRLGGCDRCLRLGALLRHRSCLRLVPRGTLLLLAFFTTAKKEACLRLLSEDVNPSADYLFGVFGHFHVRNLSTDMNVPAVEDLGDSDHDEGKDQEEGTRSPPSTFDPRLRPLSSNVRSPQHKKERTYDLDRLTQG
jgi:hypothetical protein